MSKVVAVLGGVLAAMSAAGCDESDGGGPIGGGDPGGGGVGRAAGPNPGEADGGGPDAGAGTCGGFAPSDPRFGCAPMLLEQPRGACGQVIACGGFLLALSADGRETVTCGYRSDGTLAWAQRCADAAIHCGRFCLTSAGTPTPVPSCPLPSPCDGGVVDGSFP